MRAFELLPQFRRAGCQLGRTRSFLARRRQRLQLLPNLADVQIRPGQVGDQVGGWLVFFDIASPGRRCDLLLESVRADRLMNLPVVRSFSIAQRLKLFHQLLAPPMSIVG
jgi:hypothetical protein